MLVYFCLLDQIILKKFWTDSHADFCKIVLILPRRFKGPKKYRFNF